MSATWKVRARARRNEWAMGKKENIAVLFDYIDADGQAKAITWYGYFTDKTWQRTVESMRYMGWQGDDLNHLDGLDTNEVELVLGEETYEGTTRTKVQWVNKATALALKEPMDEGQRATFAARMRGRIAGLGQGSGQKRFSPPPATQQRGGYGRSPAGDYDGPDAPDHGDDDLPF